MASFPAPIARNPYQAILYRSLRDAGIEVHAAPRLSIGWLRRNAERVSVLHFHWPQEYYRYDRGGAGARMVLSWARTAMFGLRLAAARALGYRIVWTVHQVYPHETESRSQDRLAGMILARSAHALIAHDFRTAQAVTDQLLVAREKIRVIPHGSYEGVYPAGRSREAVRSGLGISADAFVVLSFGQIRRYKELTLLLDAFEQAHIEGGVLLIVGLPLDEDETQRLEAISRNATNVVTILEYVPDNCVAELFAASDVFGSARLDGGTSGALVLALSLGLPVVAAKCPAYDDLTDHGEAGWLFAPGTKDSLASALRSAATDSVGREAKARRALQRAACLRPSEIAARTAVVLRGD